MTIATTHKLLTALHSAKVDTIEAAIGRLAGGRSLTNACQVCFFEMVPGGEIHVNVTHVHRTTTPDGWAGPGKVARGFVHSRAYGDAPARQMIGDIRDMIFSPQA